jgi:chromatin remodeling complex protein RSC6
MAKSKQGSAKKASTDKTTSSRRTSDAPKQGRGGIAQPVTPSPELGAIIGTEPLTRAELTKRVWDYIKSHDLQDAKDRRQINADDKLKKVLGRDQVSMFEMTKLINQHVK